MAIAGGIQNSKPKGTSEDARLKTVRTQQISTAILVTCESVMSATQFCAVKNLRPGRYSEADYSMKWEEPQY